MKNPLKSCKTKLFNVIFAVRDHYKLISNVKNNHTKVGNKIPGQRTVASTEDLNEHLFVGSRSDCPLLFTKNFIKMRDPKGNRANSAKKTSTSVGETIPTPEAAENCQEAANHFQKCTEAYVDEMIKLRNEIDKIKEEMYLLKKQTFNILVDHLQAEGGKS